MAGFLMARADREREVDAEFPQAYLECIASVPPRHILRIASSACGARFQSSPSGHDSSASPNTASGCCAVTLRVNGRRPESRITWTLFDTSPRRPSVVENGVHRGARASKSRPNASQMTVACHSTTVTARSLAPAVRCRPQGLHPCSTDIGAPASSRCAGARDPNTSECANLIARPQRSLLEEGHEEALTSGSSGDSE
jgi:hypothetical protein